MLSKIISRSLTRTFCTTLAKAKAPLSDIQEIPEARNTVIYQPSSQELDAIQQQIETQQKHLASFISGVKSELRQHIELNFDNQVNSETVILQTSPGSNTFKFGELLVLGSSFKLLQLLAGFPTYPALVTTLGVAGIGAALSYSNYLKRQAHEITSINWTADGKLHIYYNKAGNLFGNETADFIADKASFGVTSFGCSLENWVRKCNDTQWVKVGDELFWYNADNETIKINSHEYHKLF